MIHSRMAQSLLVLLLMGVIVSPAVAEKVGDNPETAFLLQTMGQQRLLLKSGIYRIENGLRVHERRDTPDGKQSPETFSIFCAFADDRFRFDRTMSMIFATTDRAAEIGGATDTQIVTYKWCQNLDRSARWRVGEKHLLCSVPSKRCNSAQPIDIRALGLMTAVTFDGRYRTVNEIVDTVLSNNGVSSVTDGDVGQRVISCVSEDDSLALQRRFWIDVDRGYTASRSEILCRFNGKWENTLTQETKWALQGSAWVPVSEKLVSRAEDGEWRETITFDVKWESVNEPVDEKVFTYADFGATDQTGILDDSTGELMVIRPPVKQGIR